jgi:hypothetical protein
MTEFLKHINGVIRTSEENNTYGTRIPKVAREIQNFLTCYKELYRKRKNTNCHRSLDCFIKKCEDHQPTIPGTKREQESDDPDSPDPVHSSVRSI